jgi:hypothetical protein
MMSDLLIHLPSWCREEFSFTNGNREAALLLTAHIGLPWSGGLDGGSRASAHSFPRAALETERYESTQAHSSSFFHTLNNKKNKIFLFSWGLFLSPYDTFFSTGNGQQSECVEQTTVSLPFCHDV